MEEKCQVIIYQDDNTKLYLGMITGMKERFSFNPLTILTELSYKNSALELGDFNFDDWDYEKEYAFGTPLALETNERRQYVAVVKGIKKIIRKSYSSQSDISLTDIELLKPFFDITFQFTPITRGKQPNSLISEYKNLHERFVHYSSFSMDTVLDKGIDLYTTHFYQCYSLADILFSILHFLAVKKYKFSKCVHCNRYFATNNLKNIYCNRFSQYPKYEQYTCYDAVKRIRQDIRREHRRIYSNLSAHYYLDKLNEFESSYHNVLNELIEHSNYETIDRCYEVVDKNKWYTKSPKQI